MGVMACERDGCDNILCDSLLRLKVDGTHYQLYICRDCLEELQANKATWQPPMTMREVHEAVWNFMNEFKGPISNAEGRAEIEAVFQRILQVEE